MAMTYFIYVFFVFAALHNETTPPPYALPQLRSLSIIPSIVSANILLIVAFFEQMAATLGQRPPPPSLYFLMCLVSLPQTREPALASMNPVLGTCGGPIESNGAMIWGRRCPIQGERAKLLDRAVAATHFDCCVLCKYLWLCFV
jgi:hypothetical protein